MPIHTERLEGSGSITSEMGSVPVIYRINFGSIDVNATVKFTSLADYAKVTMSGQASLTLENGNTVECFVLGSYIDGTNEIKINGGSAALIAAKT
ncbi:hypothetical protein BPNPMPFG_000310 [Mesorhizobium sp. AR07]|uniref:hypothetical protein n=1 Tax=Mesorhizobium sp. AR07 TaxID=2865838 RepID=UPI00215FA652|nr:hypothetical protein [Mesorhizobium sp. AR07]UVK44845.1 hypothetical protein BPNPMPFG_000310 [Mesorhizobium sp. AR07]